MSTTASFTGSIPENYDTYLGPILFEFSGADLAQRVNEATNHPADILEVACGTGISTRHLAEKCPSGTRIQATDINQAMLDHAAKANGSLDGVTYSQADALDLPFDDESFDAVVCPFGIMFFPDKAAGMKEFARVLKPGGIIALNVWDSLEKNPSVGVVDEVIKRFFETDPPRFLEVPFGMNDTAEGRQLLLNAGLDEIEVHHVSEQVEISSHDLPARGFVTGNPTILQIQERATVDAEVIISAAAEALSETFGPAPTKLTFQEITYIARKPTV